MGLEKKRVPKGPWDSQRWSGNFATVKGGENQDGNGECNESREEERRKKEGGGGAK